MDKAIACIILIALTIAFAVGCVVLRRKGRSFEGMVCKFMSSFGFISLAVFGNYLNDVEVGYFCFLVMALMFGFFGDVMLGIKEIAPTFKKKLIVLGTAYFMVGHIFCIVAFAFPYGMNWYTVLTAVGGALIAMLLIKVCKLQLDKKFRILLPIYYSFLVWKIGLVIWMLTKEIALSNILLLIGSTLFLVSDTALGFLYFTPTKKKNFLVTLELSTYYPAQILIALSIMFR